MDKCSWKGHTQNGIKRSGQARLVYVNDNKSLHPQHVKVSPWGPWAPKRSMMTFQELVLGSSRPVDRTGLPQDHWVLAQCSGRTFWIRTKLKGPAEITRAGVFLFCFLIPPPPLLCLSFPPPSPLFIASIRRHTPLQIWPWTATWFAHSTRLCQSSCVYAVYTGLGCSTSELFFFFFWWGEGGGALGPPVFINQIVLFYLSVYYYSFVLRSWLGILY